MNYLKKVQDIINNIPFAKTDSRYESRLYELFNVLTKPERTVFIQDILTDNSSLTNLLFDSNIYFSASEASFNWLIHTPINQLQKITEDLEGIMDMALEIKYVHVKKSKKEKEKYLQIINRIKAIVASQKTGLSYHYLSTKIDIFDFSIKEKLDFWLLSIQLEKDNLLLENKIDLEKEPLLTPVLIASYKDDNPTMALKKFIYCPLQKKPSDEFIYYFKSGVKWTIYNLIKGNQEKDIFELIRMLKKIRDEWKLELVKEIVQHPKFLSVRASIMEIEVPKITQREIIFEIVDSFFNSTNDFNQVVKERRFKKEDLKRAFKQIGIIFKEGDEDKIRDIGKRLFDLNENLRKLAVKEFDELGIQKMGTLLRFRHIIYEAEDYSDEQEIAREIEERIGKSKREILVAAN